MDPTSSPHKKHKSKSKEHRKDKDRKRKRHIVSPDAPEIESPIKPKKPKKARIEIERVDENAPIHAATPSAKESASSSAFYLTTTSLYLALSPRYSFDPKKTYSSLLAGSTSEESEHLRSLTPRNGIRKHHLDPMLMKYYPPLGGVVVAYDNIRFESSTARIIAESPYAHVWVTVDFLVWKPRVGMVLQGFVNLASASHIGMLVENMWNASIPLSKIPENWKYVDVGEDVVMGDAEEEEENVEGGWKNERGEWVRGLVRFTVEGFQAAGEIVLLEGSLLDREALETEGRKKKHKKKRDR